MGQRNYRRIQESGVNQMATQLKIEFARGDSYARALVLKQDGQAVTDTFDEIYFTVKRSYEEKKVLFQKRMSTGGIVTNGSGYYTLYINPEDTDGMDFGDYDFDFEFVKNDGGYKRTFPGKLRLAKEVTYASNE